jgi:hypothetical protein
MAFCLGVHKLQDGRHQLAHSGSGPLITTISTVTFISCFTLIRAVVYLRFSIEVDSNCNAVVAPPLSPSSAVASSGIATASSATSTSSATNTLSATSASSLSASDSIPFSSTSNAATSQSTASTSKTAQPVAITDSIFTSSVNLETFIQNQGTTITLSGASLQGVAITSNSVSLAGNLVLDLSGMNIYDGIEFTLVNSTLINGQWDSVIATQVSSSECTQYQGSATLVCCTCSMLAVEIRYTQTVAIAVVHEDSLCAAALRIAVLVLPFMQ